MTPQLCHGTTQAVKDNALVDNDDNDSSYVDIEQNYTL